MPAVCPTASAYAEEIAPACLVVGSVLTLLNQGDALFAGTWRSAFWWKIPLTYSVPFCVATWGALANSGR